MSACKMQSSKSSSSLDLSKSPKRYSRNVMPNVTINNIVTIDPEKFNTCPSRSSTKLHEDSDYERVKFIVEERAKYWRDLKVLYNDYTLVKLKQKELLDSEDNYVNKHCIEETIKLTNALKLKIQKKCKDIIFITNLCGNSEVNRVVQSLADGEDIDSVLIKKQRSAIRARKQEAERKKNKHSSKKFKANVVKKSRAYEEEEEEEKYTPPPPPVPPRRKSAVNEPKFFDSELHWCQYCNVFPPTIKKYLQHLHDDTHKKKIKELKINESPWHKCLPEEQAWRTDSTDSVCVKAFNFFVPANGWFCQLCRSWMGDIHCAATHLRSYVHNMNLKNFQEKFPEWKQGWLEERGKALESTFEGRKESVDAIGQQQVAALTRKKKEDDIESSSAEEDEEPISRHRTSKAEMWVPNQKAFERVRKETNSTLSATESSLVKIKGAAKKDRPAFIGKMPLINRSKKIVVKDLPQNTTEKIATSCEETDKLQRQKDELTELIIRRNEKENELKLKEFMRVADKIKNRKKKKIELAMLSDCYNATEFMPVVETVDPIDNLINPPALIAQWEAEANYEYHMRQLHQYNMASQMMQMSQPFLLDPYHAIALHNQQYYNSSSHMMSNQYENFEIISREDEQVYSQYIEFQNSPSSSPASKMFASGKTESKDTQTDTAVIKRKTKPKQSSSGTSDDSLKPTPVDSQSSKFKRPSEPKVIVAKKPTTAHTIQKPPCLSIPATDLMPSFKETFLGSECSSGYIASLLSSNEDVKILRANEPFKKRQSRLSKRKRILKKKGKESQIEKEQIETPGESVSEYSEDAKSSREMKNIPKEEAKHLVEPKKVSPTSTPTKTQSLKQKINSIRKKIKQNQISDESKELIGPVKRPKLVTTRDDIEIEYTVEERLERHSKSSSRTDGYKRPVVNTREDIEDTVEERFESHSKPSSRTDGYKRPLVNTREDIEERFEGHSSSSRTDGYKRQEVSYESEESEEEGDVDKLIYYDMTSI